MVSVTLEGKKSSLAPIVRLRNFSIIVDLTEYEEGEHTVELEHEGLPDNVSAYIEPKERDITSESRATREVGIDIDSVNFDTMTAAHEVRDPDLTPCSVS